MLNIPIFIAFFAGIVSFLSPCILPIIPGFLAYLGGASSENATGSKERWGIFLNSLFFVIGFSIVFAVLRRAFERRPRARGLRGADMAFVDRRRGHHLLRVVSYGIFQDRIFGIRAQAEPEDQFRSRYLTSLLFGFAFAAGWTPCVGPVLGGILGLVASAPGEAFPLLLFLCVRPRRTVPRRRRVRGAGGALDQSVCHRAPLCDDRFRRRACRARYPRLHPGPFARSEFRIREQSSASKIKNNSLYLPARVHAQITDLKKSMKYKNITLVFLLLVIVAAIAYLESSRVHPAIQPGVGAQPIEISSTTTDS